MTTAGDDLLEAQYADSSLPPNVVPSERILLGCVLVHGIHVARPLIASDFYRPWHGQLFQHLVDLYAAHPDKPYLDPVAVKDDLFRRGLALKATDMFCMYDDAISRWASAGYHVERILETAEARLVQAYGQRLAQLGGTQVAEVMQEMQDALRSIRARAGFEGAMEATRLDELVRLNRIKAATESAPAASTGLIDLDRVLNGGLRPATFNVLGARPGVGKSLLAGAISVHLGSTLAHRVLYVTLELTAAEVTNRMIANIANIELTRLQNPEQLDENDYYRYSLAEEKIAGWPVHIEEGSKTIGQIEDVARAYLGSAPSGLLVVDHLGRIREDGIAPTRERHVALWSSRLTDLAHELKVPVLCVAPFSRESVKRGGPPHMADIRDSGSIESDADTVMLMWQPQAEDETSVELIVDKNRYGAEATITLNKQGHRGRLVSAARGAWAA